MDVCPKTHMGLTCHDGCSKAVLDWESISAAVI